MKEIITDLDKIKYLGQKNENENLEFRSILKSKDYKEIDKIVHRLYKTISEKIDCTKCGNCCKEQCSTITNKEIERLSNYLKISTNDFEKQYIKIDEDGDKIFAHFPCKFLKDNQCEVYELRPEACKSYPHLHKNEFTSRLFGVVNNYSICPIVYNVYEALKDEVKVDDIGLCGYFDDNGNEINMDLIKKPGICSICKKDNNQEEEILCNLNRFDQRNDSEFKCFAFEEL